MVVENGGKFSMNLNNSVTHCIAAESSGMSSLLYRWLLLFQSKSMTLSSTISGIKYQAAKRQRDVIHFSWVLDCCSRNILLPLQPKWALTTFSYHINPLWVPCALISLSNDKATFWRYFLHLTDASRTKLQDEIDEFSDSYFFDLDLEGLKQVCMYVQLSIIVNTVITY